MDVPYTAIFLGLLVAYLVYSLWARLDGRYPIGAALALLVVTAIVDAAGDTDAANSLAEFVFFLLAGGVVLLLIEHVRDRPSPADSGRSRAAGAQRPSPEPPEEPEGSAEQALHGLEQEPVALVDRTGDEDGDHEPQVDADGEGRQPPEGNAGV